MIENRTEQKEVFSFQPSRKLSAPQLVFPRRGQDTGLRAAFTVSWVVAACTALGIICSSSLANENVIMIYLLGLTFIATRCSIIVCALACALSVWAFDFFIVPPIFNILPSDPQFLLTFALMFIVSLIVSMLVTHQTRAQRLLQEQSRLLDLTNDAILEWDINDNRIIFWNVGAEKLFQSDATVAVGQNVAQLLCGIHSKPLETLVAEAINTGHWSGEVTYKRPDGTEVPVLSRWTVRLDAQGKPASIVEFATDISDRRGAELRVKEFYSTVSHELRTPLTSIRGSLLLIEKGIVEADSAEGTELVELARTQADRLMALINDILDLQKIESGKFDLCSEAVDVNAVVSTVLNELKQLAHGAGIKLLQDVQTNPIIEADSMRIAQVLTNLVANAIKFSPPGSDITVATERRRDVVRVTVIDHGPGIPPNQIGKLFGRFQQLDSSDRRNFGGTGLGLAICKGIVEQHGGVIGVDSEPGKGSSFWFELRCLQVGKLISLPERARTAS